MLISTQQAHALYNCEKPDEKRATVQIHKMSNSRRCFFEAQNGHMLPPFASLGQDACQGSASLSTSVPGKNARGKIVA